MAGKVLDPAAIKRHSLDVRIAHWIVAVSFILLGLSGLALFYPPFFFLTAIMGGGETARLLHPWIGLVLALGYCYLFARFILVCLPAPEDVTWMLRAADVMAGREENLPEIGKFNPGQKLYFWLMAGAIVLLLVSGVIIWRIYFGAFTTIELQRVAVLTHSIVAALAILGFIFHLHMATWEAGSLSAMIRGTVTGGWAWKHHRKWLREMVAAKGGKAEANIPPAE
jgi:formate dehydrogenase subunit gamma